MNKFLNARLFDDTRGESQLAKQAAFAREKCAWRVELDFAALLHYDYSIIVNNRVQSMRNRHNRSASKLLAYHPLNERVRFEIYARGRLVEDEHI